MVSQGCWQPAGSTFGHLPSRSHRLARDFFIEFLCDEGHHRTQVQDTQHVYTTEFCLDCRVPLTKCIGMRSCLDRGPEPLLFPSTACRGVLSFNGDSCLFSCLSCSCLADFTCHSLGSLSGNVFCHCTRSNQAATCSGYGTSAVKCFAAASPRITAGC